MLIYRCKLGTNMAPETPDTSDSEAGKVGVDAEVADFDAKLAELAEGVTPGHGDAGMTLKVGDLLKSMSYEAQQAVVKKRPDILLSHETATSVSDVSASPGESDAAADEPPKTIERVFATLDRESKESATPAP